MSLSTFDIGYRASAMANNAGVEDIRESLRWALNRLHRFEQANAPRICIERENDLIAIRREALRIAMNQNIEPLGRNETRALNNLLADLDAVDDVRPCEDDPNDPTPFRTVKEIANAPTFGVVCFAVAVAVLVCAAVASKVFSGPQAAQASTVQQEVGK